MVRPEERLEAGRFSVLGDGQLVARSSSPAGARSSARTASAPPILRPAGPFGLTGWFRSSRMLHAMRTIAKARVVAADPPVGAVDPSRFPPSTDANSSNASWTNSMSRCASFAARAPSDSSKPVSACTHLHVMDSCPPRRDVDEPDRRPPRRIALQCDRAHRPDGRTRSRGAGARSR